MKRNSENGCDFFQNSQFLLGVAVVLTRPGRQRRGTARTLPKFLCYSMYCLFCVVLCVCVCVCTVLLPLGGYPIAVNKYIRHILHVYTVHQ